MLNPDSVSADTFRHRASADITVRLKNALLHFFSADLDLDTESIHNHSMLKRPWRSHASLVGSSTLYCAVAEIHSVLHTTTNPTEVLAVSTAVCPLRRLQVRREKFRGE